MHEDGGGIVVVSSGFHKTHVTTAAGEASDRGLLRLAITGAYPTARLKRVLRRLRLADRGRVARLLERGEPIPEAELRPLFIPELLDELARLLARIPVVGRLYRPLSAATWRLYGRLAARKLREAEGARLYLYRAGFGGRSIDRARELGMVAVCDHSTVHPALLERLLADRGRMPSMNGGPPAPTRDPIVRRILEDIDAADAVLVNSNFVKQTFLRVGWPEERIHVVYLGVDDNFVHGAPPAPREASEGRLRLLFAGRFERDKGAEVLIQALSSLDSAVDWELVVAGPILPQIKSARRDFLEDPRVITLGTVPRPELRRQLLAAPVFVFPSFAEGSARAAFEALACGCYVITTPNSGTIVEDGVHGALVPPDDPKALAEAIADADRDRKRIAEVGRRNAELVASSFSQDDYGDGLAEVFGKLVETAAPAR